jgi:hypothetical protein
MMSKKNKELLSELMAAVYAKEILERIEKLLSESEGTAIEKEKIEILIEESSESVYFE